MDRSCWRPAVRPGAKNLAGLAEAWPAIHRARPDLALVLSGPTHPSRTTLFSGLPSVHQVGNLDAELIPGLMASACALVVPSHYEGFGIPGARGNGGGGPGRRGEHQLAPEVVGDAAILVEPDAAGLTEGVLFAASSEAGVAAFVERGSSRAAYFTWERSVAGHAQVWRAVAAARG